MSSVKITKISINDKTSEELQELRRLFDAQIFEDRGPKVDRYEAALKEFMSTDMATEVVIEAMFAITGSTK